MNAASNSPRSAAGSGASGGGSGSGSSAGGGGSDSTLTAASLIDAIITHQINQTSATSTELGPPGSNSSKPSAVENLFKERNLLYRRNPSPLADSRSGPPKERHREDSPSSLPPTTQPQRPPSSSPSPAAQPMTNRATFTLGEHIESIIAKDFHQGASSGPGGPTSGAMNEQDLDREREWHRRQAAADYPHKSRMPAPESMANDYSKQSRAATAVASAQSREGTRNDDYGAATRGGGEPDTRSQPSISPLDYVKKKIVEVMRTSSDGGSGANHDHMAPPSSPAPSPSKRPRLNDEGPGKDERGGPSPVGPPPLPHYLSAPYPNMGYPFSIPPSMPLNASAVPPVTSAPGSAGGPSSAGNQPVVVLSSQYEPLSDSD